ncbi:MAG: DUF512 domain-containing protein [Clostridia bacterium]|nr:DUF512 domain-containing protein [Clostridia bacterium]
MPQKIVEVAPHSLAAKAGLKAGEILLSISGTPVLDLVDYQFLTARPHLEMLIEDADQKRRTVILEKRTETPLGITLESSLMSQPKTCANHCMFCFIEQMPPGMRESLYVRDDDWRLSLMAGNFVTLTNLPEREMVRIIERHASPLYISVHTTNGELRKKMLSHVHADRIMEHLKRFAENGLSFHCQIVLCPGINDGEELRRTLSDLSGFFPHALSAAIVPVGLTRFREHLYQLHPYTRDEARAVLDIADEVQEEMLRLNGTRFVFPSDEFYQIAERPIPPDEAYEDYPQYENGVGLLRRFETEFRAACRLDPDGPCRARRVIMATGTSVAPFMNALIASTAFPGVEITVKPILNHFFGETVTVSGLLTGQDLLAQLRGMEADEILITESMLRKGDPVFLDDMSLEELTDSLGIPVIPVPNDGADLLYALRGMEA